MSKLHTLSPHTAHVNFVLRLDPSCDSGDADSTRIELPFTSVAELDLTFGAKANAPPFTMLGEPKPFIANMEPIVHFNLL